MKINFSINPFVLAVYRESIGIYFKLKVMSISFNHITERCLFKIEFTRRFGKLDSLYFHLLK
jgi:hypothetical protein